MKQSQELKQTEYFDGAALQGVNVKQFLQRAQGIFAASILISNKKNRLCCFINNNL